MADVFFKRILHPVGQGAFFTEQFLDENGTSVLNVVYDCGSFTSQPNLVEYEIRNTFEKNAHIDLLFISHFDEDHVNGLMTLQNQTKIDKDTKVIIPFKYPYLLMVMDDDYPTLARFVMRMFNIGAQVIGVDDGINENRHGEPIDIDRLDGNITLGGKNMIRLDKVLWYYYPFMLPDQSSLQKVFEGMVKGIVNLDDPNEILTKRKELRDIYKTIGKTKGGVTRINVNALFMLSFPAVDLTYNTNIWHQINLIGGTEPTCFYTGDSNLKGNGYDEVKQRVTDILDAYSTGTKVSMMQVPHHGSGKCFPEKMADRMTGGQVPRHGEYIIFPYRSVNGQQEVIDEEVFQRNYPFAYHYLEGNREELAKRDNGHKKYPKWYAYGRSQALNIQGKRLLLPHICDTPCFVFCDNENLLFYDGYSILAETPRQLEIIKRILSSDIFWYYITKTSKPYSGGFFSLEKRYIQHFGIPRLTEEQENMLLSLHNQDEVNEWLSEVYGIWRVD